MVKMRKRRYPQAYERQSLEDLESAASDAVDQLERESAKGYRVLQYVGQPLTVAVWDMVHFAVDGTVDFPIPATSNAGKRVAMSTGDGVTAAVIRVASGKINGASTYTLGTANRKREFVSNGIGWLTDA